MSDVQEERAPLLSNQDSKHKYVSHENAQEPSLPPLREELKEMTSMATQLSLRRMVRQAMALTDTAFLGHLGTKQLAGVAIATAYMGLFGAIVEYGLPALSTLCSQAYGAGNNKLVGIWLQMGIMYALVGSIPVIVSYFSVGQLISITMDDEETIYFGTLFARIMAATIIPQYVYGAVSAYFASLGVITPATITSVITVILNIGFNQIFIHGAFGWEGLGFIGSPLATFTSTCFQLFLFTCYTVWWKRYHENYWDGWNLKELTLLRIMVFLKLVIPMGASAVIDWIGGTLANAIVSILGPNIMAAQAVMFELFSLIMCFVSGFCTGTQIFMARHLGRGSAQGAQRIFCVGTILATSLLLVLLLITIAADDIVFRIWTEDEEVLALCSTALMAFGVCTVVAICRFMQSGAMNALSLANYNFYVNAIGTWIGQTPLTYVLPILLGMGINGAWWADTAGEVLRVIFLTWLLCKLDWKDAVQRAQRDAEVASTMEDDEQNKLLALESELSTPTGLITPTKMVPSMDFASPRVTSSAT